jgi:hypothetical protein
MVLYSFCVNTCPSVQPGIHPLHNGKTYKIYTISIMKFVITAHVILYYQEWLKIKIEKFFIMANS